MAETKEKQLAGNDDNSMEDILNSIKNIIGDKSEDSIPMDDDAIDDDVMELTQMIEPNASTNDDVLNNIDAALGTTEEKIATPTVNNTALDDDFPLEHPNEILASVPPEPTPVTAPVAQFLPETVDEIMTTSQEEVSSHALEKIPTDHLVSDASAAATMAALKELKANLPKPKIVSTPFRSGNTVEDLVVEAVKPMLSEWLNANLPLIVRELVQKEIEKLVPHERRE